MCLQEETPLPRRRRSFLHRASRGQQGAELVEFAVLIPALVMLLLGIIWFGRAYNVRETVTRAAREGARWAIAPTCASCGNTLPTDSEVRSKIDAALVASSVDPNKVTNFTILRNQVLNPGTTPQTIGTVIRFEYPFTFVLPFTPLHLTTISLPIQVQMREE